MLTRRLGLRLGQLAWAFFAASFLAGACSKGDDSPPTTTGGTGLPGTGGKSFFGNGGTSGNGGSGPAGEGGMAGETSSQGGAAGGGEVTETDPYAPTVRVTSPEAVRDPNDPNVIVDDEIDALCSATKSTMHGSAPVDAASVVLSMLDADGKTIETAPGVPTDNQDEYTAHFITRKVADNGRISFVCVAAESSQVGRVGRDQIDSFVDHGPAITAVNPPVPADSMAPLFAIGVNDPLQVEFEVSPAPVATGDDGANVGDVELTIGGKPCTVGGKLCTLAESKGKYTATVHLNDSKLFTPTPDGDQKIVIAASDQRKPNAVTSQLAYDFLVDGSGPDINIVSPKNGDIWAGRVQMMFTVIDSQSGVDQSTVTVFINQKPYAYDAGDSSWSYDVPTSTYSFAFDTTQIENSIAQATLSVRAVDLVGNESDTADVLPRLDNVPPYVELDPLAVREIKDDGHCSLAFDPVGSAAPNDLQTVPDAVSFRAFVWDDTNRAKGDDIPHAATVDVSSVVLVLQPAPSKGLLRDISGDGVCDSIDTKDDAGQKLPAIQLLAVPQAGNAFFGPVGDEDATLLSQFPMPAKCAYGPDTMAPQHLCDAHASDLGRVVHWSIDPTVPAIFAVPELSGIGCTGQAWEIRPLVSEGWICAAVRAKDKVGNVGISVPLRLCYDDGVDPPADCSGPPPSCVIDGCTPPPRFPSNDILLHP